MHRISMLLLDGFTFLMNKYLQEQINHLNYLISKARDLEKAKSLALDLNDKYPGNLDILHSLISIHIYFKNLMRL